MKVSTNRWDTLYIKIKIIKTVHIINGVFEAVAYAILDITHKSIKLVSIE